MSDLQHRAYMYMNTQPSIPPGRINRVPACPAGVKAGCVRLCRVADTTVLSHMASDIP